MSISNENNQMLTFGGHLEVFRKTLFRIIGATCMIGILIFCFKDVVFKLLLAPSEWNFITYSSIEYLLNKMGIEFHFEEYYIDLISTDLSSQFMIHISTSLYLGLLVASPYILFELFRFVSPALYDEEKKYSIVILIIVYLLFILGVLMSYYIIFPISFRFLGTYSVAERVESTITLKSYISTFTSLTLVMGVVFQLPVIAYVLGKLGVVNSEILKKYRKHAIFLLTLVSTLITPPDILSCILVTIPLYMLYELSISVIACVKVVSNK